MKFSSRRGKKDEWDLNAGAGATVMAFEEPVRIRTTDVGHSIQSKLIRHYRSLNKSVILLLLVFFAFAASNSHLFCRSCGFCLKRTYHPVKTHPGSQMPKPGLTRTQAAEVIHVKLDRSGCDVNWEICLRT